MFLVRNSAIGSPYFQSIALGFECAMFLAGLLGRREMPLRDMLEKLHIYLTLRFCLLTLRDVLEPLRHLLIVLGVARPAGSRRVPAIVFDR